jgi:hypothetical protein
MKCLKAEENRGLYYRTTGTGKKVAGIIDMKGK